MSEAKCVCGVEGQVTDTGSASGRKHYRCPACGAVWRGKNAAAVALGALGGKARAAALSPEQRVEAAKYANDAKRERIRLRTTPSEKMP